MTPQQLVDAAQQGNPDAFAELWKLYRGDVHTFVYRRLRDRHTTEDITSETFLRAWRSLAGFTWQGKGFRGWLITIAAHLVADHYNSAYERNSRPFDVRHDDEWHLPTSDRRTQPEQAAEQATVAAALDAAIPTLTATQRETLAWRFGAGLRIAETAEVMCRGQRAVQSAQHKAIVALRRHPAVKALAVTA